LAEVREVSLLGTEVYGESIYETSNLWVLNGKIMTR